MEGVIKWAKPSILPGRPAQTALFQPLARLAEESSAVTMCADVGTMLVTRAVLAFHLQRKLEGGAFFFFCIVQGFHVVAAV